MKTIPIFKPGTHLASDGQRITFSKSDVQGMVAAYNTKLHEAPIVVGHPKDNAPAYGWVESLAYSEELGQVVATPRQVMQEFDEMVQAGRFKKRSASLYPPDSPNNPVPGQYYLQHVGFLGAQAPAIKGLEGVQYKEDMTALEFADPQNIAYGVAAIFRRMRDWLIEDKGLEIADSVIPSWNVEDLEAEARTNNEPGAPIPGAFSENKPEGITEMDATELKTAQDKLAADQAALVESQAAFGTQQTDFAEKQAALRLDKMKLLATGMAAAGKIPAAQADEVAEFMAILPASVTIEYGEGDDKKSTPVTAWFAKFVEARPEVKPSRSGVVIDGAALDDGVTPAELAAKILAYQEAHKVKTGQEISIVDTVAALKKDR